MMLMLGVFGLAAFSFVIALSMDGAISRAPLQRLADFPFKGLPATNGATLVFVLIAVPVLVYWLLLDVGPTG